MALVERDAELAALHAYAHEARRGEGRLVLVAGEAGVGKSVLIEELQRGLVDADVAWGTCDGLSPPRPLAPLFDLAPQLGGRLLKLSLAAQPDRDELFRALLTQLDGARLRVLVIEDIHWADEATLDLVRFLARRIRTLSLLLVLSYRDDWPTGTAPLRVAMGELATLRWSRRVELAPLSPHAVRVLSADSAFAPEALFALTGGNPFYVTEVIEAGTTGVPLSARDAVLARTARLSDDAAKVLACASLLGTRVDTAVLTAAAMATPEILDDLISSGLLVEEGRSLRFRHEIARLAVEQQIPTHRRTRYHAKILAVLRAATPAETAQTEPTQTEPAQTEPAQSERAQTDDARMAYHAEGAGDEQAVLHHSYRAARRSAELGSHREAMAQYERALRSVSAADDRTAALLYAGLAEEASLADRWQLAAEADEQALRLWRGLGDQLQEGHTLRHFSLACKYLCRGEESVVAAESAVSTLEPLGPTAELAAAYAAYASVRMTRNEHAAAAELARRAQRVARLVGAVEVTAGALDTEGVAQRTTNPHWPEPVRRGLELALSHNLQSEAGRAYVNLYGVLSEQYRFREAEQYFRDGIAYCDEHDLDTHTYCLLANRTVELQHQGAWDEALAICERLLQRSSVAPLNLIYPRIRVGTIRARRGDPDVWRPLDEALEAALPTGEPQFVVPAHLARTEAFFLDGRLEDGQREAELAAEAAFDVDPWTRGELCLWLQRTRSDRTVDGDLAEPYGLGPVAAAQAWDDLGCRYNAALALVDSGTEPELLRALHWFEELGAAAAVRTTRQTLRQLGVRSIPTGPRPATRTHPFGLTPREQQVLDLICSGRTNAAIARELFISIKTVDHHVSAVLVKLDAGTRGVAAATARRLGLVSSVA